MRALLRRRTIRSDVIIVSILVASTACVIVASLAAILLVRFGESGKLFVDQFGVPNVSPEFATAEAAMSPGDTRQEIRDKLSLNWVLVPCDVGISSDSMYVPQDLVFPGKDSPSPYRGVIVRYQVDNGEEIFDKLFGLEYDQVSLYDHCIPGGLFGP